MKVLANLSSGISQGPRVSGSYQTQGVKILFEVFSGKTDLWSVYSTTEAPHLVSARQMGGSDGKHPPALLPSLPAVGGNSQEVAPLSRLQAQQPNAISSSQPEK